MILRRVYPKIAPMRPNQSLRPAAPVNTGRTATPAAPFNNPAAPPSGGSPATPATPGSGSPWESDPILQQIRAQVASNIANAEASSLAQRQKALIQFGYDPTLNSLYGDANTSAAAQKNPFSTLAQLLRAHTENQTNLNESYNKNNLFYSGHRGQALEQEGTNYLQNQSNAQNALQALLTGIQGNLTNFRTGQQGNLTQGMQDAYNRWLSTHPTLSGPSTPGMSAIHPTATSPVLSNLRNSLKRGRVY